MHYLWEIDRQKLLNKLYYEKVSSAEKEGEVSSTKFRNILSLYLRSLWLYSCKSIREDVTSQKRLQSLTKVGIFWSRESCFLGNVRVYQRLLKAELEKYQKGRNVTSLTNDLNKQKDTFLTTSFKLTKCKLPILTKTNQTLPFPNPT